MLGSCKAEFCDCDTGSSASAQGKYDEDQALRQWNAVWQKKGRAPGGCGQCCDGKILQVRFIATTPLGGMLSIE